MGFIRLIILGLIILITLESAGLAKDKLESLSLFPSDRLLIVAPHPDDDIIGAGGLIQQAVAQNISVKVVYLTNGDSNSLAFLYYKKWPVLTGRAALKMGELRQQEAIAAAIHLGLRQEDLIFLGYPDFGTLNMFKKYFNASRAYRSVLTKVNQVPYSLSLSYQSSYRPENVLEDFKKIIKDFLPTKIFVTHPSDHNPDHQAAFLFLRTILWDLDQEINPPLLLTYLIHATHWPRPLGFYPDLETKPLKQFQWPHYRWISVELTSEQVMRKKEAVGLHRTQIPYKPNYLLSFVRSNELFCELKPVVLKQSSGKSDFEQGSELKTARRQQTRQVILKSVSFVLNDKQLYVKIHLGQKSLKDVRLDLYLLGYSQKVAFAAMPKLNIKIDSDLGFFVFDGKKRLRQSKVNIKRDGSDLLVSVPLEVIGMPNKLMSLVDLRLQNLPMETTAWQILELDHGA